jgi:hypothetical protein
MRARNLTSLCEIASGIDDDTWGFHLRRGHDSAWIAKVIRDDDLARAVAGIEQAFGPLSRSMPERTMKVPL